MRVLGHAGDVRGFVELHIHGNAGLLARLKQVCAHAALRMGLVSELANVVQRPHTLNPLLPMGIYLCPVTSADLLQAQRKEQFEICA